MCQKEINKTIKMPNDVDVAFSCAPHLQGSALQKTIKIRQTNITLRIPDGSGQLIYKLKYLMTQSVYVVACFSRFDEIQFHISQYMIHLGKMCGWMKCNLMCWIKCVSSN